MTTILTTLPFALITVNTNNNIDNGNDKNSGRSAKYCSTTADPVTQSYSFAFTHWLEAPSQRLFLCTMCIVYCQSMNWEEVLGGQKESIVYI